MKKQFKKLTAASLALTASLALAFPSYAAGWVQSPQGWWWSDEVNGSPASCWRWLDGNGDGWAECYYFDSNGYMAQNTTTPDNYQVDANGAWIVNGVVQRISQTPAGQNKEENELPDVWLDETEVTTQRRFIETKKVTLDGRNKTFNLSDGSSVFWSEYFSINGYDGFIKMNVRKTADFHPETLVATILCMDGTLTIYGDDDEVLESFDGSYSDPLQEIEVDISDQNIITLKTSSGPHYVYFKYLHLEGKELYH